MSLKFGNYPAAFYFIVLAAIFDFMDGFAARLLKAYSPLGMQLDSLSDVVSFGAAPGFIVYRFLSATPVNAAIPFFAFLIPLFAALRLAKFNIDTRQTSSFLGMPVPANALFWAALIPYLSFNLHLDTYSEVLTAQIVILILIVAFCLLMTSELPMFSLKFKHYKWRGNEWSYALVVISALLFFFFKMLGVSLAIISYILLSLIRYFRAKFRNKQ
jgi:CDP-diacylglycerol--serine O-phosphatidyltransferase